MRTETVYLVVKNDYLELPLFIGDAYEVSAFCGYRNSASFWSAINHKSQRKQQAPYKVIRFHACGESLKEF